MKAGALKCTPRKAKGLDDTHRGLQRRPGTPNPFINIVSYLARAHNYIYNFLLVFHAKPLILRYCARDRQHLPPLSGANHSRRHTFKCFSACTHRQYVRFSRNLVERQLTPLLLLSFFLGTFSSRLCSVHFPLRLRLSSLATGAVTTGSFSLPPGAA